VGKTSITSSRSNFKRFISPTLGCGTYKKLRKPGSASKREGKEGKEKRKIRSQTDRFEH